jgi:hypothetical protein
LSAQKSDTGIPQQLVEAKKAELIQEKVNSPCSNNMLYVLTTQ